MTSPDRYLWLAPNAGLWPSFQMEHRLAAALQESGRDVTLLRCDGAFSSFCPVMSAERLAVTSPRSAKREVCRDCQANARVARAEASYASLAVDDFLTEAVREQADRVMASVDAHNWQDLVVDGLPVGRWAAYTAMLHHKLPDVTGSEASWREYLSDLRHSLMMAAAMPTLLDRCAPTHVVVYNPLYPVHRVFVEMAMRYGAQLVGLHAGGFIPSRYETVGIYAHVMASQTMVDSPPVRQALSEPCSAEEVATVGRHVRELIAGNDPWVYSSAPSREGAESIRRQLDIRPDSPVVAALLSSPDETRATTMVEAEYLRDPDRGYSSAQEFIAALKGLARARPDIDVVMRLHPRLVANKRESVTSPDLERLLAELEDLPSNAHLNVPGDGVALYDLIGITSAAVNHTSSAGLEFLILGIPVVAFDPIRHNIYPAEFGPSVERDDAVRLPEAVDRALAAGWDLGNSTNAFRWYSVMLLRAMLLLSDVTAVAKQPAPVGGEEATEPRGRWALDAARRIVPETLRERGARMVQRRSRLESIPQLTLDERARAEWLERLDALNTTGVVWSPEIRPRGDSDVEREAEAIRHEVAALCGLLGYRVGPGVGVVGAALSGDQTG